MTSKFTDIDEANRRIEKLQSVLTGSNNMNRRLLEELNVAKYNNEQLQENLRAAEHLIDEARNEEPKEPEEDRQQLVKDSNDLVELKMDLASLMRIDGLERSMGTQLGIDLQKHFNQMNYEEQAVVLPSFLEIAGAVGEVLYKKNRWILGAPSKVDVGDAVLNLLKKKMTVLTIGDLAIFIDEVMQEHSIVGDPMSIAEGVYERLGLMKGTNYGN